jgi:hypothetical protein
MSTTPATAPADGLTPAHRFQLRMRVIDGWITLARTAIIFGTSLGMVYFAFRACAALAGEQTSANFVIQVLASVQADRWVAYLVAGVGATYGIREAQLRRKILRETGVRIQELEQRLDPDRSSSGLTASGQTRMRDQH